MNNESSQLRLRAGLFVLAWLTLVLALGYRSWSHGGTLLQTDLLALLPADQHQPLAERAIAQLDQAHAKRVIVLLSGPDSSMVQQAAQQVSTTLGASKAFHQVLGQLPDHGDGGLTEAYLAHRFFLLSADDRQQLQGPDFDLTQSLRQHIIQPLGPAGMALPLPADPLGWLGHWLAAGPWSDWNMQPEDGWLSAHQAGQTEVLVLAELAGSSFDQEVQDRSLRALAEADLALQRNFPTVHLEQTGAVLFAAAARRDAERDMHRISLLSTLGIVLLLGFGFRSPSAVLLAFASTAMGIVAGLAVTVYVFGSIHLLTLVFGAALLGEAVDYSIQFLLAWATTALAWSPRRGLRQVRPALLIALSTSVLGYALLTAFPLPAFRQMACFAISGLSCACAAVFFVLPSFATRPGKAPAAIMLVPARQWLNLGARLHPYRAWLLLVAVLVAVTGICRLRSNDDIHRLVKQPVQLLEQAQKISTTTGIHQGSAFYLIDGSTVEQVAEREQALTDRLDRAVESAHLSGYLGLTRMRPSLARQQLDHQRLQTWFDPPAKLQQAMLRAGLSRAASASYLAAWPGRPLSLAEWLEWPSSQPYRYLAVPCQEGHCGSVVTVADELSAADLQSMAAGLVGVRVIDPAGSVSALFRQDRHDAARWVGLCLLLMAAVFGAVYGWRIGLRLLLPPVLAIALSLGLLGLGQQELTLFHWMGLMLGLGVGANYPVFLRESLPYQQHTPATAYAGVLLSACTALLSFGLLALSSMPALAHFGLALLLEIAITVSVTPLLLAPKPTLS